MFNLRNKTIPFQSPFRYKEHPSLYSEYQKKRRIQTAIITLQNILQYKNSSSLLEKTNSVQDIYSVYNTTRNTSRCFQSFLSL